MWKSILVLSLLAAALVSDPLRAEEAKSLEAQVKDLARKVEALQYDLDQVRKLSDDALFWLRLSGRTSRGGSGRGCEEPVAHAEENRAGLNSRGLSCQQGEARQV